MRGVGRQCSIITDDVDDDDEDDRDDEDEDEDENVAKDGFENDNVAED